MIGESTHHPVASLLSSHPLERSLDTGWQPIDAVNIELGDGTEPSQTTDHRDSLIAVEGAHDQVDPIGQVGRDAAERGVLRDEQTGPQPARGRNRGVPDPRRVP